jgi:REP element-mobilizing transposase RayT
MPRKLRNNIFYDGCYAHVFSRALEKKFIFKDDEDFNALKDLLAVTKRKYDYRIYHYCLMHTHYHLAVSMNSVSGFSMAMKIIKQTYLRQYRKKYKGAGTIWRGRYGSQLIEDERYLYLCGEYIENNPVRAGLVKDAAEWPHSSAAHYGGRRPDRIIDIYGKPQRKEIESLNKVDFEKGNVIGSEMFHRYFEENNRSVPREVV